MSLKPDFDLAVVGAGPAGSSAARIAAERGLRVVLIDKAEFPRYKTCGGGIIGTSGSLLPPGAPYIEEISAATFTLRGEKALHRQNDAPFMRTTSRVELDQFLLEAAADAGAEARLGADVRSVIDREDFVELQLNSASLTASYVIGAEGTSSKIARQVGVELAEVDLGLEIEVESPSERPFAGRIHIDWGPIAGSYAWVFPKGDTLTVGVIARKGKPQETRQYLTDFTAQMGLSGARVVKESGHLTRYRTPTSPLGAGRMLVAGDAAGLLEPWTREGISFALRSGRAAGSAVVASMATEPGFVVENYRSRLSTSILPEMAAGSTFLTAFERHPGLVHRLVGSNSWGWGYFTKICRGESDLARAMRHPAIRLGARAAAAR